MRFPLLKRITMVLFVVMLARVDQRMALVERFKMARFPSRKIVSSNNVGSSIGLSLFATHAGVSYHLLVFPDAFVSVLKKANAYLPFFETSLSSLANVWPAEMVSVVAELAGMHRENNSTMKMRRDIVKL
ncbi:hypothetical protein DAI22_04g126100 [Oryza sativa Japonica Group]|nr:hypothetical protein DAI22_04g126100 [Oryza sativa Japonica Group]